MNDMNLFDKLKAYLTKEFIGLSDKRDEMLYEKVRLEVEKQREEHQLFQSKADVIEIKKLFSPLDDDVFNEDDFHSHHDDIIMQKIQKIEKDISVMDDSMEEIKEYICFIQKLETSDKEDELSVFEEENSESKESGEILEGKAEPEEVIEEESGSEETEEIPEEIAGSEETEEVIEEKSESEEPEEVIEESESEETEEVIEEESGSEEMEELSEDDELYSWSEDEDFSACSKILEKALEAVQEKYPDIEILTDFEEIEMEADREFYEYFISLLSGTISVSSEKSEIDSVIIEGERRENKIIISLQLLLDDEKIDQYSYQYEINLK